MRLDAASMEWRSPDERLDDAMRGDAIGVVTETAPVSVYQRAIFSLSIRRYSACLLRLSSLATRAITPS